jgi:hypothetical protein
MSTTKTKVMAFQGKYPIRSKIILNNKSIIQQDLNGKLSKFENMWSNCKNIKEENQERNKFKILQNYGSFKYFYMAAKHGHRER